MKIIKHVENLERTDAKDLMNKIISKIFLSAYGKNLKKIIIVPLKYNPDYELQIEVQYSIDKRRKGLFWKP